MTTKGYVRSGSDRGAGRGSESGSDRGAESGSEGELQESKSQLGSLVDKYQKDDPGKSPKDCGNIHHRYPHSHTITFPEQNRGFIEVNTREARMNSESSEICRGTTFSMQSNPDKRINDPKYAPTPNVY